MYPPLQDHDEWTWDIKRSCQKYSLLRDDTLVLNPYRKKISVGVRGNRILNHGIYFWEVEVVPEYFGTYFSIGIGTKSIKLHEKGYNRKILGEDENGWGLSNCGYLYHNGKYKSSYTKWFKPIETVTIGLLFNGLAGTLTYYKDGVRLNVAFHGLDKIKEDLYPIICSSTPEAEFKVHNMRRRFPNLEFRCSIEVIKNFDKRFDLLDLELPEKIKTNLTYNQMSFRIA